MKAVLVLVLVCVVANAEITSLPCPGAGTTPTLTTAEIQPYYKYSYQMPEENANGAVWINVDSVERLTQGLWLRVTSDATTALTANMNVRLTVNRAGMFTDPVWALGSLTQGEFTEANTFGLPSSFVNITLGDKIWFTFFPTCSTCSSTVEFSVETAWYIAGTATDNYPPIPLVNNTRTMVFEFPESSYLPTFYTMASAGSYFYVSVAYDNDVTTTNSEIVLYWNKDTPFNGTGTANETYPFGFGTIRGDYLTQVPFHANTSGTYYLTTYVKVGATGSTDPEFTIKVGFNSVPCASGSVLSVSLLLALLPFLAFLWN